MLAPLLTIQVSAARWVLTAGNADCPAIEGQ